MASLALLANCSCPNNSSNHLVLPGKGETMSDVRKPPAAGWPPTIRGLLPLLFCLLLIHSINEYLRFQDCGKSPWCSPDRVSISNSLPQVVRHRHPSSESCVFLVSYTRFSATSAIAQHPYSCLEDICSYVSEVMAVSHAGDNSRPRRSKFESGVAYSIY